MRGIRHERFFVMALMLALLTMCLLSAVAWASDTAVTVQRGATPITNGSCVGDNDITISNAYLAISIAVDTSPPWGVPYGSILDGTTVTDGVWGSDKLTLVDFLPNDWAAWPNTYQNIAVTTDTADKAVVTVTRDYSNMTLVTTYTVTKDSRFVDIKTVAENPSGSGETYSDLFPGYTFCTTGGYMFGPYGTDLTQQLVGGTVTEDYGKYVLGYDKDYTIGLHFPKADAYAGGTGWKDLLEKTTFAPGDSVTFEARVEFEDSASICRLVKSAAENLGVTCGTVSGSVTASDGTSIASPLVIAKKNGETFTWAAGADGSYSIDLPPGDYDLYAVAQDCSASATSSVTVTAGGSQTIDFTGVDPSSTVTVKAKTKGTKKPIDARIAVSGGTEPVVGYLGKSVFYTSLTKVGTATFKLAPGEYTFSVTSGVNFTSKAVKTPVTVTDGEDKTVNVAIRKLFSPSKSLWFCADLHHHSNILDGVTSPKYVVRSQLAAGLDFTCLSDHDSYANNATMYKLSKSRGVPFISSDEISPIWAHFGVFPVSLKNPVAIDPDGTAEEIISAAHKANMVIAINHPYIAYGYFYAQEGGTIPGGYSDDYDLIELQSTAVTDGTSADELTLAKTYQLWTGSLTGENKRHYIKSGSDVHDVWASYLSGYIRTYVHLPKAKRLGKAALTQKAYLAAMTAGHSYVTEGPLVQLKNGVVFGQTHKLTAKHPRLRVSMRLSAVNKLKELDVVRKGKVVRTISFTGNKRQATVTLKLRSSQKTWYSFVVEDQSGNRAVTNPIWVNVAK